MVRFDFLIAGREHADKLTSLFDGRKHLYTVRPLPSSQIEVCAKILSVRMKPAVQKYCKDMKIHYTEQNLGMLKAKM